MDYCYTLHISSPRHNWTRTERSCLKKKCPSPTPTPTPRKVPQMLPLITTRQPSDRMAPRTRYSLVDCLGKQQLMAWSFILKNLASFPMWPSWQTSTQDSPEDSVLSPCATQQVQWLIYFKQHFLHFEAALSSSRSEHVFYDVLFVVHIGGLVSDIGDELLNERARWRVYVLPSFQSVSQLHCS